MKKIITILLTLLLFVLLFAGCGKQSSSSGEISVFYYTFSDTYISGVRSAMDKMLKDKGLKFNDYDANSNQSTQTEQVDVAISKGSKMLVVNVVDTGSDDAAKTLIERAKSANIPIIFFNRSVDEEVVKSYDKCVFVGTDYEMAGRMQGEMIGKYLLENYDKTDLNKDGKISYVMFKGEEGNMEAIARTKYGVEDCNQVLQRAGKPELQFYDPQNTNKYLVDQNGNWSSAAATNYMSTLLAKYSESNKNMVELIIANNDEMALGAISALQSAGYNKQNATTIPVFGVDATDAARSAIKAGSMTGTIKQDSEGMAEAMLHLVENFTEGNDKFKGIDLENVVGDWRVNIPYSAYTGN